MTFRTFVEERLDASVNCPWPGPRPIPANRPEWRLVGRSREVQDLLRLVRSSDVVVVSGASGVGKTSLLNAGLLPLLKTAGFRVVTAEPAAVAEPGSTGVEALAREIRRGVGFSVTEGSLGDWLEDFELTLPDRIVVFVDQFEEVLRSTRSTATRLLRAIEGLASRSRIRFVISVRSEFEHQLSGRLGLRLGAFRRSRYEVPEVSDLDAIRELILSGNDVQHVVIDETTAEELLGRWESARDPEEAEVGLLNLQALLFCLWRTGGLGTVELATLEEFGVDAAKRYPHVNLFDAAVSESVRLSMDMALEVLGDLLGRAGANPLLVSNATLCMRQAAQYLGSHGYKVVSERRELARETLRGLTSMPGLSKELFSTPESRLLESAVDGVFRPDRDGPSWLSDSRASFGLIDRTGWPWEEDELLVTSGPILGMKPTVAYFEFYRAFLLGTELLSAAGILRSKGISPGETTVSLIHDRFVAGLEYWSSGLSSGPDEASARLLATVGGSIEICDSTNEPLRGVRTVFNLRWRHGVVSGPISNAVFVNCDFSGSRFDKDCVLQGVTFVNCMLDDVLFESCVIRGAVRTDPDPVEDGASGPDLDEGELGDLPSYRVRMDADLLASLSWYEGSERGADCLLSLTGGMPAVSTTLDRVDVPWVQPTAGGVAIHGGRVTGFKTRGCTFEQAGVLSLRSVAGTSVEFADQTELRVEIVDSIIRGLAISCPQDVPRSGPSFSGGLDLTARGSILVGVWVGAGLTGRLYLDDCRVWQLLNASSGVTAWMSGSRWNSLVNVPRSVDSSRDCLRKGGLGDMEEAVVAVSKRIDFRAHPTSEECEDIFALLVASGHGGGWNLQRRAALH